MLPRSLLRRSAVRSSARHSVARLHSATPLRLSSGLLRAGTTRLAVSAQWKPASALSSVSRAMSMKVRAAVARGPGLPFTFDELTLRSPRDDEILVRVHATGVCHTDIAVKDRNLCAFPMVLGHEGVGVVERVGSRVASVAVGDHVMMSYASCGGCPHCAVGKPAYCYSHGSLNFAGRHADGSVDHTDSTGAPISGSFFRQSSFASHALCTENNCFKVDKSLPLERLAPLNCGIQTGAGAVINTFKCPAGSSIAVFGCGAVGLSAVMAARVVGCSTIVALDLTESRLGVARELGATHTICVGKNDTPKQTADALRALTAGGVGVDYALETSGNRFALRAAFDGLKPLGSAGLIGGAAPGVDVSLEMLSMLPGKSVRGIIQGDAVSKLFVPQLIALWQAGRFPYDRLITFYDGLESLNTAAADAHSGKVIKPVIRLVK